MYILPERCKKSSRHIEQAPGLTVGGYVLVAFFSAGKNVRFKRLLKVWYSSCRLKVKGRTELASGSRGGADRGGASPAPLVSVPPPASCVALACDSGW